MSLNLTLIDWVKNPDGTQGYTWNPITGCLNHTPEGLCLGGMFPCYAYKLANGRLRQRYLANENTIPNVYLRGDFKPLPTGLEWDIVKADPFYPRFWEDRIRELDPIWKGKHFTVGGASKVQPKGIFVCDMSDLFGIGIPEEWTRRVLDVIRMNHQHRFYLLTKQPQNLIKFSPFPDNCYVGVTATNPEMTKNACYWLSEIEARIKFISFEPLLSEVAHIFFPEFIDWVSIGACTGTYAEMFALASSLGDVANLKRIMPLNNRIYTLQPKIEWVEEIVRACDKAGIPVFQKNNLWNDPKQERYRLRQEMPNG